MLAKRMHRFCATAGGVKIALVVFLYHQRKFFAVVYELSLYPFVCRFNNVCFCRPKHGFCFLINRGRRKHFDHLQLYVLHFGHSMSLVVLYGTAHEHVFIYHVLQT